jgi:hypothetical protein
MNIASRSVCRALDFLFSQPTATSPGWGPERGQEPDPWTTSQVLFVIRPVADARESEVARAVGWLESAQNQDGSWWSEACGPSGDTMATACATICLLDRFGAASVPAVKGLDWLCKTFSEGWTTVPLARKTTFQKCHFYSTAFALRALARGPRRNFNATCIQEGVTILKRQRTAEGAWGFQEDQPSDPTFTAYVLHSLLDVGRVWGLPIERELVARAMDWLLSAQNPDGSWCEWHGVKQSPEAAGYALYVALSFGLSPEDPRMCKAIEWLVASQEDDGGWVQEPGKSPRSCNWVTQTVVMGLKAYFLAARQPAPGALGDGGALVLLDFDTGTPDELPRPRGTPVRAVVSSPESAILRLYSAQLVEKPDKMSSVRPLDHTMYEALDRYVADKLPGEAILKILQQSGVIEVHGIYPDHFPVVAPELGMSNSKPLDFKRKPKEKRFNRLRPTFYLDAEANPPRLLIAVIPGEDYFFHYASMVRHFVNRLTAYPLRHIRMFRYPDAEREIVRWTGLCERHVRKGDRVVLGYVERVEAELLARGRVQRLDAVDDDFYGSSRYLLPDGSTVALLGVKYCFWGSISELLCYGLCELGASEIIYVAKLGALTKPADIYHRVFCPSGFVVVNHREVLHKVTPPPNRLLGRFPELDSGYHVSVPTVLEEDYQQREVLRELNAASIDNEISQIASAISLFNRTTSRDVAFAALHFATDYIRQADQKGLSVVFDLGNDKTDEARQRKTAILSVITQRYLLPYLEGEEPGAAAETASP